MTSYNAGTATEQVQSKFRDRPYERKAFTLSDAINSFGHSKKVAGANNDAVLTSLGKNCPDAMTTCICAYFSGS